MEQEQKAQWKQLMKSMDFFKPFQDEELEDLLKICALRKYQFNEFVVKESKPGYIFFIIMRGSVDIIKEDSKGLRRRLASLKAGDCFGEMSFLLNEPRSATVLAGKECFLFEVDLKVEELKLETQVKIFRQFAITLSKRLKVSNLK